MNEWIKKMCAYSQWTIIQPEKKKKILPFVVGMNFESIMLSEMSQERRINTV